MLIIAWMLRHNDEALAPTWMMLTTTNFSAASWQVLPSQCPLEPEA